MQLVTYAAIGAAIGAGIAAAQGGNAWKGAAIGAMGGVGSCYGLIGAAAGGALGALVTGSDPGMAAATAAIIHLGVEAVSNLSPQPGTSGVDSHAQEHLQQISASQGNSGVSSILSYAIKMTDPSTDGTTIITLPLPVPPFIFPVAINNQNVSLLSNLKDHILRGVNSLLTSVDNAKIYFESQGIKYLNYKEFYSGMSDLRGRIVKKTSTRWGRMNPFTYIKNDSLYWHKPLNDKLYLFDGRVMTGAELNYHGIGMVFRAAGADVDTAIGFGKSWKGAGIASDFVRKWGSLTLFAPSPEDAYHSLTQNEIHMIKKGHREFPEESLFK